jgi:hypothetical protein
MPDDRVPSLLPAAMLCGLMAALTGCVERTIRITSEPSGALVWLNDREIGRTPVDVEFVHYGTYDVRLELAGHEPVHTFGEANAPLWDAVGFDLFAELAPFELQSNVDWHFTLEPEQSDQQQLIERARDTRSQLASGDDGPG